jgi:hypothetical protein
MRCITPRHDCLCFPMAITLGSDGNRSASNFGFGPPPAGLGAILEITINCWLLNHGGASDSSVPLAICVLDTRLDPRYNT